MGEIRATIERKTIRAPFSGILGIRQINLGQYLTDGAPIVPLQALNPIYVNFSVPQQQVGNLKSGAAVQVKAEGAGVSADGQRDRGRFGRRLRDPQPPGPGDVRQPDGKLRPGMFVQTSLSLGASSGVVALPASAISYAPYGDSVFVVEEMKDPKGQTYRGVRQQFVKLGAGRGDQIAVVSGVKAGQEVVTSGVFKLRNGAAVQVNNTVQPGNNPAPRPEDS